MPKPPTPPTKGQPVRETPTVSAPTPPPSSGSGTVTRPSVAYQPVRPGCPAPIGGTVGSAPSKISPKGVAGTSTADLNSFALAFNATRLANCLRPVPLANFRYDSCMEARLFWMAEDPSTNPASAWGHIGTVRSDGVPSVGCDGNLAGGMNNTGQTVATKWWQSTAASGLALQAELHGQHLERLHLLRDHPRWRAERADRVHARGGTLGQLLDPHGLTGRAALSPLARLSRRPCGPAFALGLRHD